MLETTRTRRKKYAELDEKQLAALRDFAQQNGAHWRSKLRALWQAASATPILHALRNSHGPRWLSRFKLPEA